MYVLKFAAIVLCGMLATTVSASERLIYAVTRGGFGKSTTEIFAVSADDPQARRVFSDASLPVAMDSIPHTSSNGLFPNIVLGNHMFAMGRERASLYAGVGIFEFSLDGSGRYRKILDLPADERVDILTVAGDGTKLAYLSLSGSGLTLFIHDVRTGSLLRKLDMRKIAGDCPARNLAWLPDNKTLFFTLQEGDEDDMEDADAQRFGTWFMREDGTSLTHLPATTGVVQEPGYTYGPDLPPVMMGVVNGQYLFHVALYKRSQTPPFLGFFALADPASGKSTKMVIPGILFGFDVARSGRHMAYIEQGQSKYVGNTYVVPPAHLWIQNLLTGESKEILTMETGPARGVALALVGWMEE